MKALRYCIFLFGGKRERERVHFSDRRRALRNKFVHDSARHLVLFLLNWKFIYCAGWFVSQITTRTICRWTDDGGMGTRLKLKYAGSGGKQFNTKIISNVVLGIVHVIYLIVPSR